MSFGFGYRSAVQAKRSHDKCLGINQTLGFGLVPLVAIQ